MIYFTSDQHFFHANVIRYCSRPFSTVDDMNEALIANWNAVVTPEDTVYCFGDLSLAIRPIELFSYRLNGTKYLIPGNHDWCHPANKKSRKGKLQKWIDFYGQHGWKVLPIFSQLDIEGIAKVNLCHMPYQGDYTDERFPDYRMENDGRWLLCGHIHEKWKIKDRMINVGVDVWDMKPVSIQAISTIITNAEGK